MPADERLAGGSTPDANPTVGPSDPFAERWVSAKRWQAPFAKRWVSGKRYWVSGKR
jgi:hypothetical protein